MKARFTESWEDARDLVLEVKFGKSTERYRKDRRPWPCEDYTAERVRKEAARRGHLVCFSLSLDTGWDFLNEQDRTEVIEAMQEKPQVPGVGLSLRTLVSAAAVEPFRGLGKEAG